MSPFYVDSWREHFYFNRAWTNSQLLNVFANFLFVHDVGNCLDNVFTIWSQLLTLNNCCVNSRCSFLHVFISIFRSTHAVYLYHAWLKHSSLATLFCVYLPFGQNTLCILHWFDWWSTLISLCWSTRISRLSLWHHDDVQPIWWRIPARYVCRRPYTFGGTTDFWNA